MQFKAIEIAQLLNGKIIGDKDIIVSKLSKIEEGAPGSLSFLSNPIYTNYIYTTQASVVIVNESFVPEKTVSATMIQVADAYTAFAKLLEVYNQVKRNKKGISPNAYINEKAQIGKDVYIGEHAFIGDGAIIGDNTKIYPFAYIGDNACVGSDTIIFPGVRIYSDCVIGDFCTMHSGVVIGGDGFGFAPQQDNNYQKVAQIGNVVIKDHVEIGANTTIDRATLGSTIIHSGVKLDNLIQIAHNVEICENTVIAAQTGVSGSTKIGKNCMIGGQVGIVGHITIADNVKIAAQSGIGSSITEEGAIVQGSPAFEIHKYKKAYVNFRNLSQLVKRIEELENIIKNQKL